MNIYTKVIDRVKINLATIREQIRAKSLSAEDIQKLFSPNILSEQSRDKADQKQFGIFYTPPTIAQYFLLQTLQKDFRALRILFLTTLQIHDYWGAMTIIERWKNVKILDPACGSGIFLLHALQCLYQNWLTLQKDWKVHTPIPQDIRRNWDETQKEACQFLQMTLVTLAYPPKNLLTSIILNQLYGADINVEALIETQANLWLEAIRLAPKSFLSPVAEDLDPDLLLPDISVNFSCGNAIITLPNRLVLPRLEALSPPKIHQLITIRKEYLAQCLSGEGNPSPSRIASLRSELQKNLIGWFEGELREKGFFEILQGEGPDPPIFWEIQYPHVFFGEAGHLLPETQRGFTHILGNPPYIHQKGTKNAPKIIYDHRAFFRHYYLSADSSDLTTYGGVKMNSFTLFLELSTSLLRPEGTLALLLHKNFLTVESYKKSRKFLLDHTQILEIVDVGSQIFPQITGEIIFFIARKNQVGPNSPSKPHLIHVIPSVLMDKISKIIPKSKHFTPQNLLLSPPNYVFHLNLSPENIEIRKIITENSRPLKHYAKISSYGLNVKPHFISATPQDGWVPAIRGKHIGRYLIKNPIWILYTPQSLTRPGNVEAFTAPEKLVMQRIGGKFATAYDDQQHYVFNSVNMILPHSSSPTGAGVSLKYLLGILNSTPMRFYIQKFFTLDAAVTINITKGFLDNIPIPDCPPHIQDQIVKLVTTLEQNQYSATKPISDENLARIRHENQRLGDLLDKVIFRLYGLKTSHIRTIHSQMR